MPKSLKTIPLLVCIISAIVFYSCRKPSTNSVEDGQLTPQQNPDISLLKKIYDQETGNTTKTNYTSSSVRPRLIRGRNLNWKKYYNLKRSKSQVIQFDVTDDSTFLTLKQYHTGDTVNYRNRTSAVFLENPDGKRLNFYMKVIEELDNPNDVPEIANVSYNHIPYRFSGIILYYSLKKDFLNGYKFKNGKPVKTISLNAAHTTNQLAGNKYKPLTEEVCSVIPVYDSWCEWASYNYDGSNHYIFNGCYQNLVGITTQCIVTGGTGGGGGDGSGGGGGVAGDGDYANEGYSPDKVVKTDPTVKANANIDCILSKLDDGNWAYNKFLAAFIQNNGFTVTFKVDKVIYDQNDKTKEVNANSVYYNKSTSLEIHLNAHFFDRVTAAEGARTIIHEMAHVYLAQKLIDYSIGEKLTSKLKLTDQDLFDMYAAYIDPVNGGFKVDGTTNNNKQHEYMATNLILDMANGIKDFVERNTPITAQHTEISIDNYMALAYQTIRGTQGYKNYINQVHETDSLQEFKILILKSATSNDCN